MHQEHYRVHPSMDSYFTSCDRTLHRPASKIFASCGINSVLNALKVKGFPIYGTAQPTEAGFKSILEKVPKGSPEKPMKTIWYNMRQEPVVYINGIPYAPRHPEK